MTDVLFYFFGVFLMTIGTFLLAGLAILLAWVAKRFLGGSNG